MFKKKEIKLGRKVISAYLIPLQGKNLILLKGSRGYIMCGYLNLSVANKFHDAAAKIIGVTSIKDALKARIHSCTAPAKRLGIKPGQRVLTSLKNIA